MDRDPRRAQPRPRTAVLAAVCGLLAALALVLPASAESRQDPASAGPSLDAASWVLIDRADGEVLASRNADERRSMASTTKLMTALVSRRELDLSEQVIAPPYSALPAESLMGLTSGERISVEDLLYGLLMVSGNDAAVALATAASGSVPAFVDEMNAMAAELGLDDTSYENPIGLDGPAHYTTAADLTELTQAVLADPLLRRIVATRRETLRGGERTRNLRNSNELLQEFGWVRGVKTGYTIGSGYVLVSAAKRDGTELIGVVMGAPSELARDAESVRLLEYGFSLYRERRAIGRGERLAEADVSLQNERLALVASGPVRVTARRDQQVEVSLDAPNGVEGPIERGAELGTATVRLDGEPVERVSLLAARSVGEPSTVERIDGWLPGPRTVVWVFGLCLLVALLSAIGLATVLLRRRN